MILVERKRYILFSCVQMIDNHKVYVYLDTLFTFYLADRKQHGFSLRLSESRK